MTASTRVRISTETALLMREPLTRIVTAALVLGCLGVGFGNGSAADTARGSAEDARARIAETRAAIGEGAVEIDGAPADAVLRGHELMLDRAEFDLRYGSLLGTAEAVLALFASAGGLLVGVTLGAVAVGRDHDRRTWAHEFVGERSRNGVLWQKGAAGLTTAAVACAAGAVAAGVGALAGQLTDGIVVVGTLRPTLAARVLATSLVVTWWTTVGMAAALLAAGSLRGIAVGLLVALGDAAVSLNLPDWAPWLVTPRIALLAGLWLPASPDAVLVTGETTSVVWWGNYPWLGDAGPVDGAWPLLLAVALTWLLIRRAFAVMPVAAAR